MRNAVLHLPEQRPENIHTQELRTAIRQLDRADLYVAALLSLEVGDRQARRAADQLRAGIASLREHLVELGAGARA